MGIEMGRVSGPLLSENLLRNGDDLAFDTDLLYLDVNNRKIGIKNDSPTRNLSVADARTPYLIVDTQADIANFSILTNKIQNPLGRIYIAPNQSLTPTVTLKELQTANLSISNQLINNLITNDNINISASGTGIVKFTTPFVNISGWMHATGNVTWDGTITFGNNNLDNVSFGADITSSILPHVNDAVDLGTSSKYWKSLYTTNVITTNITSSTGMTSNNINLILDPGHTIYVATTGSDLSSGRHASAPYLTIKNALANAVSGDEIVIFPGTYTEIFPLTVPQGVSVRGTSIRSVIIKPTTATKDKDAFLLNGDTTLSFLTIQDFFYNSTNNTGYGIRFANNFKSLYKSPYIYNVTVITKGSVTTVNDPIGFTQGDAGAGALIDGSVADATGTIVPSILLAATTFITPNQDSITATNGVRVEWNNSFTYFAKRGIYLTTGSGGLANLGIKFGAEFRSVNSANVYGTYGAVADGLSTKGYLSSHNFGYIGSDGSSINDPSVVNQANEIVAINGGILYYDSMDQQGDFRVGDIFYVNQKTGTVIFNAQSINFGSRGSIVFETIDGITRIDAYGVQTGNIRIHDNNIDSLLGPINIIAASGATRLSTNIFVTGLINLTGDATVKGNVFLGNDTLDTLTIIPKLTQTIKPAGLTYTLGTSDYRWNDAFVKLINVDGVTQLTNNTISTLTANTDLRLVASGTGKIQISTTDVQINNSATIANNLTITGDTLLRNTQVTGLITLVGDINQTGNINLTGTIANSSDISILGSSSYLQSYGVKILNNQISSVTLGTDLTLTANGTGSVVFDNTLKFTDTTISNRWTSATTDLQKSIVFSPNGTGNTIFNTTKFLTIPYSDNTTKVLSALGEIRQNSNLTLYEGYLSSGIAARFNNLYDNDLNTYITAELTVGANDNILRFATNGSVRATISSTMLYTSLLEIDNIHIFDNTINNYVSGDTLIFTQNGSGSIQLNDLVFKPNQLQLQTNQSLTMTSTDNGYFKFGGTGGLVIPSGTDLERRTDPIIGETRYNTTSEIIEVFNGTAWDSAVGSASFATPNEVEDSMNTWSIILG
jgi:hypothetical protein